jgi:hypothetical protein
MRNRNALMVVAALSLLVLATGCQSPSATTQPSAAAAPACHQAIMCDRCMTTWTPSYEFNNKGMMLYTPKPEMVCTGCSKAAQEYFATGKLPASACPMCGSHLRVCQAVECKPGSKQ